MPIRVSDAHRFSAFAQRQTGLLFNLPPPDPQKEQLPEGISLCMIVKNEERFLDACLASVKDVVDEICIVDTGSSDRTVEIARAYGAKLDFKTWRNDFAWARNQAIEMATKRWILVLDADEELLPESVQLVRSLRSTPADLACVYINIVNTVDDSAGAGTMSHRLIRIFPNTPLLRYRGVIHETVARTDEGDIPAVLTPITILHKGYTIEMLAAKEKDARNRPLLERAYQENNDDLFSMFNFGNSEINCGRAREGIEILERMLAIAPEPKLFFPIAYLMLAQAYGDQLGDLEAALEKINEGEQRFPRDAGIVFTKGQLYYKMGRYDDALEQFERTLDMREAMKLQVMTDEELFEWKVYYAMSGVYERRGDYPKAVESLDRAIANKPQSFHLHRLRAALLERDERLYDAERAFRSMAELEPERGKVELVNFFLRRQRYAQVLALVESESGIRLAPDVVAALSITGARALMESKSGDPLPFLEAALRHQPAHGYAIRLMEELLTERGDAAALERLHAAELEAQPITAIDFARRSYRLLALNRNEEARYAAERGLELDPENAEARFNSALASLRLGEELRAAHDFGRVEPKSPEVFAKASQFRAGLMLKHGDVPKAVAAIDRGLSVPSIAPDTVLMYVRALHSAGAKTEARALLERHAGLDRSIVLELARLMLQEGDVAGAARVANSGLS